ncbi:MAG: VWA domain-containing protein, partial [Chloroflexi bacterium]|nr:VWA domain-containing protein [Chloroflexota bacterium]
MTKKAGYPLIIAMLLIPLMMGSVLPSASSAQEPGVPETIDLVLVIDNSNSMSGVPEHTATDPFNLRIATTRALIDVASTDFDASRVRIGVIA